MPFDRIFLSPSKKIIFLFFFLFLFFFVNIFRGSCHPLFNFLLLASPVLGHLLGLFGDFAGWAGMGWAYIGCADMGQTGVPWAWHWLGWHGLDWWSTPVRLGWPIWASGLARPLPTSKPPARPHQPPARANPASQRHPRNPTPAHRAHARPANHRPPTRLLG